jgi:molecular chaperone DnaJ
MADPDFYALLGVDRRADAEEIKRAYRRLTLELHPDRHPGDAAAAAHFRDINRAYDTLCDPDARARYDATLLQQSLAQRGLDVGLARDVLGNVFGDVFGVRRRRARRGRDVRYTLTLDLAEAVHGCARTIEFEAAAPCEACSGSGIRPGGRPPESCTQCEGRGELKGEGVLGRRTRCGRCRGTGLVTLDPCTTCRGEGTRRRQRSFDVTIPAGTEPGTERSVVGAGEPGRFGGEPGDLRVTVDVRAHPTLRREGSDLVGELALTWGEAARGGRLALETIDGVAELEVPPGIRTGTRLRLRGKGVPRPGGQRGDQLVTVTIETPRLQGPHGGAVREALQALDAVLDAAGADALPLRAEQRARVTRLRPSPPSGDAAGGRRGGREGPENPGET